MTDLSEFLLARIAEDEAAARAVLNNRAYFQQIEWGWFDVDFGDFHPAEYGKSGVGLPPRVLAECKAKRQIMAEFPVPVPHYRDELDWWRSCPRAITAEEAEGSDLSHGPDAECSCAADSVNAHGGPLVLRLLALPYIDHPDYREEWRP